MIIKVLKNTRIMNIITLSIFIAWILASSIIYLISTSNNQLTEQTDSLSSISKSNTISVQDSFNRQIELLKVASSLFVSAEVFIETDSAGNLSDKNTQYYENAINSLSELEHFTKIAIVLPDQTSYITDGEELVSSNYQFTDQMQKREIYISDVYLDENLQSEAVSVNVPMQSEDGSLVAYIVGILNTSYLSEYFEEIFYSTGTEYYVIDSNGRYIAYSETNLLFNADKLFHESVLSVEYNGDYKAQDLLNAFTQRTSGFTNYDHEDGTQSGYYMPIEINNWIMYNFVPQEYIDASVEFSTNATYTLLTNILVIIVLLLIWVYRSQIALTQLAKDNERNFRFVSEQMNKYILEWDLINEEIKITGSFDHIINSENKVVVIPKKQLHKYIHEDDLDFAVKAISSLKMGIKVSEIKLRVKHKYGHFIYCTFSGLPIKNTSKSKVFERAIGFMEDVDIQEREAALLKKLSELDPLTNVLNKSTTEKLIELAILKSKRELDKHCLLIVDIDNFKVLNNRLGHNYGDEVIKGLSQYLKANFRQHDIIGRLGGDQFYVFMRNVKSDELVEKKCANICGYLNEIHEENGVKARTSGSIGVSFFPIHGNTFAQLSRNADIALYHVKNSGKNNFQFYDGHKDVGIVNKSDKIEDNIRNYL